MTKTPRTDAVAWAEWIPSKSRTRAHIVYASFARELELELAAKDAECEELLAQMDQYPST